MTIINGISICPIMTNAISGLFCECRGDGTFVFVADGWVDVDTTTTTDFDDIVDKETLKTLDSEQNRILRDTFKDPLYNIPDTPANTIFNCKCWNAANNRCGLTTIDVVPVTPEPQTEQNGELIQYLREVLGREQERNENRSIVVYLKDIIGIASERDGGRSILEYIKNIIGNNPEKLSAEGTGSSLLRELNHMHGAHWHRSAHECPEIPVGCGGITGGGGTWGVAYAGVLISEFMGGQDLDNNGRIYGRDFVIADSDTKPVMLKSIESHPDWEEPALSIGWESILAWSNNQGDNPF